jgi:hypothetical protein
MLTNLAAAAKSPKQLSKSHFKDSFGIQAHQPLAPPEHGLHAPPAPAARPQRAPHRADPLMPERMGFDEMYRQLEAWRTTHRTSHVPHRCFDAGELGAWARHMRQQRRRGELEQWKAELLNQLDFPWSPSKADAQWHANLHHLRQFRHVHGPSALPCGDGVHSAWRELPGWLQRQGELLAAGRLPLPRQQALAAVGVTLRVPEADAERGVRLQGLNAHERRLARKRWKREDAERKGEERGAAREQDEAAHALRRGQALEVLRRRWARVMMDRAGGGGGRQQIGGSRGGARLLGEAVQGSVLQTSLAVAAEQQPGWPDGHLHEPDEGQYVGMQPQLPDPGQALGPRSQGGGRQELTGSGRHVVEYDIDW